jgi:short-subunit dehydrogenase
MPSEERTLIVTGASSGIGAGLARAAAREGYRIAIVARRAERLEEVAQSIRSDGGKVVAVAGDVTAADLPARIVAAALNSFGRIDVVVNNAGRGAFGPLLDQTEAAIEAQWRLNVLAPLRISRIALPHLEATRGQLVFLGSGIARVPLPNYGAYALAKAAVRAAAIQLRRELRARGIAVTYVDPGLVASEFHVATGTRRSNEVPAASPERIARAILGGIRRRSAVVNAVPWQTAGTVLGEWFGTLADSLIISRFSARGTAPVQSVILRQAQDDTLHPEPVAQTEREGSFDEALEPIARRMERVKLPPQFLREMLVPGATIELNVLAMQWAGMPNKNERAALREALDALAAAGFLDPLTDETWKVVRGAG